MPNNELDNTFAALADPTRRAILARLAEGEATVNELAEPFHLKLPTISKHLKVLQRAGLITQGRKAQWRPCRLETAPLKEVADWVDRYRRIWLVLSQNRLNESYAETTDRLSRILSRGRTPTTQGFRGPISVTLESPSSSPS